MMLRNARRAVVIMFAGFYLAGCFGGLGVKTEVREVMGCLGEGKPIIATERCLKALLLEDLAVHEREKSYFLFDTVKTACEDKSAKNCSSEVFFENLVIEKQQGFDVVINSSIQISSKSGNIGGSFVHLVIFFDEESEKVVGWYNWKPVSGISFAEEK